jgi:hypothetical protein
MGTARVQKNFESRSIDINRQIMGINRQIMGARGVSELCTVIEASVAEFNQVVTAPHTCLSYEHTNMTFYLRITPIELTKRTW